MRYIVEPKVIDMAGTYPRHAGKKYGGVVQ